MPIILVEEYIMNTIKQNILCQLRRGTCLALASLTLMITFGAVTPAYTQDRYERGNEGRWEGERRWDNDERWREHERYERHRQMEWREHERYARHWRHEHRYRYYDEPDVIFAPPPVYYTPPPPPPGINIVVPLHFR